MSFEHLLKATSQMFETEIFGCFFDAKIEVEEEGWHSPLIVPVAKAYNKHIKNYDKKEKRNYHILCPGLLII